MHTLKISCRRLLWDRPCVPHKREGVHCESCKYFDPVEERILIIKLDALGDVLRTTCILPALKEKYPKSQISWITMPQAVSLLQANPFVDRVVPYGPDAIAMLHAERFDFVLCLDAGLRSAALGAISMAEEKLGYGVDESGCVRSFSPKAEEWLLMGLFDDLKKRNTRTYQDIIMGICGLEGRKQEIIVRLSDSEREFAAAFARRVRLPEDAVRRAKGITVVGLNTGSGSRWRMKQWPEKHCIELIRSLGARKDVRMLLFGGEGEAKRNLKIRKASGRKIFDTGCHNSLREFMALVNLCDVLVSSDTLGLHVALGLNKKVVGLFGPTSAAEIDVYGRGVKIVAPTPCACCYRHDCGDAPSCMDKIKPGVVRDAVLRLCKS